MRCIAAKFAPRILTNNSKDITVFDSSQHGCCSSPTHSPILAAFQFALFPNWKMMSKKTMFCNCVWHSTRIADGPWQLSEDWLQECFSEVGSAVGSVNILTKWLFWRRWQPKLVNFKQNLFSHQVIKLSRSTSYYFLTFHHLSIRNKLKYQFGMEKRQHLK